MTAEEIHDVIVVGAGIIGLNIAFQLARNSDLRVLVLEKGPNVAQGSTGASSAVMRARYTHPEMAMAARDGLHAYRNWAEYTGLAEPLASYEGIGTLWMMGEDQETVAADVERMGRLGIAAECLDASSLTDRWPSLNPCSVEFDPADHRCARGGYFLFEPEGGFFDPVSAAQDLRDASRGRGVEIRFGARVDGLTGGESRADGVVLDDGTRIGAGLVVLCTGPWTASWLRANHIDIGWDFRPTRIQVLTRSLPADVGPLPVVGDGCGGIYFRPEAGGDRLLLGSILESDEKELVADPDSFDTRLDPEFRDPKLWALHHRLPDLEMKGRVTGLASMYTITADVHPVIGDAAVEGVLLASGFSGHGFKEGPAVGAMVAARVLGHSPAEFGTEAPIEFFAPDRRPLDTADHSVLA
ncbi:MAG TPA: FAD-binding oxidoreductase [Acidimicrobiales bacterium]|nr:FAD-binding oxidoreductase [Acidimicrobiales bacterium]